MATLPKHILRLILSSVFLLILYTTYQIHLHNLFPTSSICASISSTILSPSSNQEHRPAYFHQNSQHLDSHAVSSTSSSDSHYPPSTNLNSAEIHLILHNLLKSYIMTMHDLGIKTWIAHGTLLGWWWGGKILPWETNVDVQIPSSDIEKLLRYHMTRFKFGGGWGRRLHNGEEEEIVREYVLDINPNWVFIEEEDVANKIDARWIDMMNGTYVDITFVHEDFGEDVGVRGERINCKDGRRYLKNDIFPLRNTSMEGFDVLIPAKSQIILQEEYGKDALRKTNSHWHTFDTTAQRWVLDERNGIGYGLGLGKLLIRACRKMRFSSFGPLYKEI